MEFPWLKQFEVGEKRFWGGHLWSRGYFFRSVGSTTDQAVEFYIKISQDKKQREKYYSTGNNKKNRATRPSTNIVVTNRQHNLESWNSINDFSDMAKANESGLCQYTTLAKDVYWSVLLIYMAAGNSNVGTGPIL